jgi:predicted ATPase with chaperone activity
MSLAEALETTRIHRVAGLTSGHTAVVPTRPFRAPHRTISDVGLIGDGPRPLPGEVSLAHYGILFLDELPECTAMSSKYSPAAREKYYRNTISCASPASPPWWRWPRE